MTNWRRITRVAGVAAGVVAAGAGTALAVQRIAASRIGLQEDPAAGEPLGELRGRELLVLAADGVPLHAEVNGPDDASLTVIFSHGFALQQDSWHYQRRDLSAVARLVFWDQRGHGRSGRAGGEPVTLEQTGGDLRAIIEAVAPGRERVVLVGHSMGGMTIMALAAQHPELFGPKVVGVVLIATAAGGLTSPNGLMPWLGGPLRTALRRAAPAVLQGASGGRRAVLVEHGRRVSKELELATTRFIGFGDPGASRALTSFVEQMIRAAPVGVLAEFLGALLAHDKTEALQILGRVPVTVVAGEQDRLIPPRLGAEIATAIPGCRMAMVPGAGHLVMLERPDVVNDAILGLLAEVRAAKRPWRFTGSRRGGTARGVA
jgi:pimeloyl-ACP methyl ester carboxylesterase